MIILQLMRQIRPICVNRAVLSISPGISFREDFRIQLDRFYDALNYTLDSGDSGWMDGILQEWAASDTLGGFEDNSSNLIKLLSELMQLTSKVARETLEPEQAIGLLDALSGYWGYSFEKAARLLSESHIQISNKRLSETQKTYEVQNQSKARFINITAQELKTPLTLVEGYAAMLQDIVSPEEDPQVLKLLEGLHGGARRLHAIISDTIDVSMIDNDLLTIQFEPLWLGLILNQLQRELAAEISKRQQFFEICEFDGAREMTFGDPERVQQAFRQVLTNAIKFTPESGHIRIDGRILPGFVEVTVADAGIGIDPADQEMIFDAFGKFGNASPQKRLTSKAGGGLGLGLHIAKGIIEAHGGTIWVESAGYDETLCPGSVFHILIPLISEPPEDPSKLKAPSIIKGIQIDY